MIRWFAKNDIAANLLLVGILLSGIWTALTRVPLQVSPSHEYKSVLISMSYRGGTAEDVEKNILIPIEAALSDLGGIEGLWATGRRGRAFFWITLEDSANERDALDEIQSRVDRIQTFPSETEKPYIRIPDSDSFREILGIAVTGNLTEPELIQAAERVRDDLIAMDGISQADIEGGRPSQISIEADLAKLRSHGLTFQDISNAIRNSSIDLSAGTISSESGKLTIRTLGQATNKAEFGAIPIRAADGADLRIDEVADVQDGYEDGRARVRFNGEPALMIRVMRHDLESAIEISNLVQEYAATADQRFPPGIELHVWDDESEGIRSRLGTLSTSLLQGCLLVFLLLALFLRPAIAFWVVIGIPVSFAGGILLMPVFDVSANLMSLFGFILVVGLVVDDAIVTGENIYSHLRTDADPLEAAILGTKEVATPVTFGVLTTVAAFIPLLFFQGHWGTYAKQIPPIVAPVLLFSLIESKLILPCHLKHVRTGRTRLGFFGRMQRGIALGLERLVEKVYQPTLEFALRHRYAVCSAFFALALLMAGYFKGGHMDFITIPSVERNVIMARLGLPNGTRIAQTDEYITRIADAARQVQSEYMDGETGESLVVNIFEEAGERERDGSLDENEGKVLVELLVPSKRSAPGPTTTEVANRLQELVGDIPEAQRFSVRAEQSGRSRSVELKQKEPMQLEIRGPGSERKGELAQEVVELLRSYEGIGSAFSDTSRQIDELEIRLKPRAAELGLTQQSLARQIRQAFYGEEAQRILRDGEEVRVVVRLPREERESLHTLDTIKVQTPSGASVSLESVADVKMTKVPRNIERIDGSEVIEITALPSDPSIDIIGISKTSSAEIQAILNQGDNLSFRYTGFIADSKKANRRTLFASLGLLFTLYALLAIPFKSATQPIIVLLAVPFGIIGAILGHMIMDITPSYLSVFGMLALAGVVVNDSLVLIDFINQRRLEGIPVREAISQAGARRFRPILLTSLTTFAGLVPLMFDKSIEGQFLIPMAVSLGYGILFATAITLYLIPSAYQISEDLRDVLSRLKGWYFRPFKNREV